VQSKIDFVYACINLQKGHLLIFSLSSLTIQNFSWIDAPQYFGSKV
jgi:hypothetical protein